ncbi:hypothetical protein T439DRAFT_324970 [Meredithblackwellia eburnea MCA 4105]
MPPKSASNARTGASSSKFSLPGFLKQLTAQPKSRTPPLTMSQAIKAASKLVPAGYNSLERLAPLTQVDMARIGIEDEDIRKGLMAISGKSQQKPNKRKRGSDLDNPLPTSEVKEVVQVDFDFEEILHEETLIIKSCIVNRAPVMTAWATVVAERLGFRRQEALSIAQVYTELNANSKGVSIGIMPASANQSNAGTSQPLVDLMGRKIPVLSMQDGEWRAIAKGAIAEPSTAFGYLQRAFRQQLGAVIGALRVLADSYEPSKLNEIGYALYCEFRPEAVSGAKGWGQKSEMLLKTILDQRKDMLAVAGSGAGHEESDESRRERELEEALAQGELETVKEEEVEGEERESEEPGKRKKPRLNSSAKNDAPEMDPWDRELEEDLDLDALGDF